VLKFEKMKLLLVKQASQPLVELFSFLENEGCHVTVLSLAKAAEKIKYSKFDGIILSIGAVHEKELQLIEQLNNEPRTDGIIIISEDNSLEFIIHCFDLGIDDFIASSVQYPILLARLKAVIKRKQFNTQRKLFFANVVIDFHLKKVSVSNNSINFTLMEYKILMYMLANKNSIIDRKLLVEYVWDENIENITSYEFLFTHMKNIRNKLKLAKAKFIINNNYGVGYKIEEI
jgi:DNA-binding response OmpR family regulator